MVRECQLKDEELWKSLNKEFMLYEYQDENVWDNPLSKGDVGDIFRSIILDEYSSNRLFLVEENGMSIGFMNTVVFTSVWAHGNVLFLDDFFIKEEFRGKGYGKTALLDLENMMKKEDCKRIQLMAENTNPKAIKFYQSQNYKQQDINFFCKYLI